MQIQKILVSKFGKRLELSPVITPVKIKSTNNFTNLARDCFELFGRETHGAEHTHATRLADGDDDVAAMGEGEDRNLDSE